MKQLKKTFSYLTPIILGVSDIVSSAGIMMYSARTFLTDGDSQNDTHVTEGLAYTVAFSTAVVLTLTRIPALWKLFNSKAEPNVEAITLEPLIEHDFQSDQSSNPLSLQGEMNQCGQILLYTAVPFSYIMACWSGGCLMIVQYLGCKTALESFGIDNDKSISVLSYFGGIGSAVSYFAFVFKGGALNNIKLLINEFFQPVNAPKSLSRNRKHILITCLGSILGAIANATFAFFGTSHGLISFPLTQGLSTRTANSLATVDACSIFYLITFSFVVDTHKLFTGFFENELSTFKQASPARKALVALGSLFFLFNKMAMVYIFYNTSKNVLDTLGSPDVLSKIIGVLASGSATFIQSTFEYKPSLQSLLHKCRFTLCGQRSICGNDKRSPLPETPTEYKALLS